MNEPALDNTDAYDAFIERRKAAPLPHVNPFNVVVGEEEMAALRQAKNDDGKKGQEPAEASAEQTDGGTSTSGEAKGEDTGSVSPGEGSDQTQDAADEGGDGEDQAPEDKELISKQKVEKAIKKRTARMIRQNRALKEKVKQLESQLQGQPQATGAAEAESASEGKTAGEVDKTPNPDDYPNEDSWFEAMEKFYSQQSDFLEEEAEQSASDTQFPQQPSDQEAKRSITDPSPELNHEEELLADLQETVEEAMVASADDGDRDLWMEFEELVNNRKIKITLAMLEFMADQPEAARIVEKFVDEPVASRRISRKPVNTQIEMLEKILSGEADAPSPPLNSPEQDPNLPSITPLTGDTQDRPKRRATDTNNFEEFAAARRKMTPTERGFGVQI